MVSNQYIFGLKNGKKKKKTPQFKVQKQRANSILSTLVQATEVQFLCAREAQSGSHQFRFLVDDSHLYFPKVNRKISYNIGICYASKPISSSLRGFLGSVEAKRRVNQLQIKLNIKLSN